MDPAGAFVGRQRAPSINLAGRAAAEARGGYPVPNMQREMSVKEGELCAHHHL